MSNLVYETLHMIGLMMLFIGVGVLATQGADGPYRKPAAMLHGIGLLVILISGFGLLAKLQLGYDKPWFFGKVVILILMGAAPVFLKKPNLKGHIGWIIVIALGAVAAYLGIFKPGQV